jgi:uncharacterized membrane protein YfhO
MGAQTESLPAKTKPWPTGIIKKYFYLALSFILPSLILGLVYIQMGVFPFGSKSVLTVDLFSQYIEFYTVFRRTIFEGGSLFYSWSKSLGGNMIGIFTYYLSSPFTLITLLFPEKYMPEAVVLITLIKIGCAGFTMALYLGRSLAIKGAHLLLFSIPYALMSYTLVFSYNIMWLDGIIFLPLIALGIERIYYGKHFGLYLVSLSLMIIANYYIAYMICLFSALYFVYLFAAYEDFYQRQLRFILKRLGIFTLSSLLSAGIAAFLLLPTYYALAAGKMEIQPGLWSLTPNFNLLEVLPKFLIGAYNDSQQWNLPNLYCGLLAGLLVLLFFFTRQISARCKLSAASLLLLFGLSFYLSGPNLIWHGFQPPVWFSYRYAFIFCFFAVSLAAQTYLTLHQTSPKALIACFFILAGLAFLAMAVPGPALSPWTAGLSFGFAVFYSLVFYFLVKNPGKVLLITLLVLGVVTESGLNAGIYIHQIGLDLEYKNRIYYSRFGNNLSVVLDKIKSEDSSFHRIETDFPLTPNDPLRADFKGLSHFSSTYDRNIYTFLRQTGYHQDAYKVFYNGGTILMDSLLAFKYIISQVPNKYEYPEVSKMQFKNGELVTYQNPYALSLGFMVNQALADTQIKNYDPLVLQNNILKSMLGLTGEDVFIPVKTLKTILENVSEEKKDGKVIFTRIDKNKAGSVDFILSAEDQGPIYAFLLTIGQSKVNVFLDGSDLGYYGENSEFNQILALGNYQPRTKLRVKLTLMFDEAVLLDKPYFYQFNLEKFSRSQQQLSAHILNIQKFSNDRIQGQVIATAEKSLLFTSIPFDQGWSVLIDGQTASTVKLLNSFVGVQVPEGAHQLEFSYIPPGLNTGCITSLVALLILLIWLFIPSHV